MAVRHRGFFIAVSLALIGVVDACWVWRKIPELESHDGTDASAEASVDGDVDNGSDAPPSDAPADCDANVKEDELNCGSCGHDCLGGSCEQGVCKAGMLVPGLVYPFITLDADTIYLAGEDGKIVRRDPDGALTSLVENEDRPQRVALDATHLYWGHGPPTEEGGVRRMPKTGCTNCTEDVLVGVGGVTRVILDGDSLFATDGQGRLWHNKKGATCDPSSSSPDCEILVSGLKMPANFELVGPFLYLVSTGTPFDYLDGEILRIPRLGCGGVPTCPLVLASNQVWPSFFTATSSHVYWSTYQGNTTMMVPVDGSNTPFQIAGDPSSGIDVDATGVYWLTRLDGAGAIRTAALDGSGVNVIAKDLSDTFYDLRVTSKAFYFSTADGLMVLAR